MLKEHIIYKEDLPVNCSIMNIDEYPIHFHNDLEVVYVLQGSVRLKNGYYTYDMEEGDIYILNDREIHSYYRLDESNVVLILQLNLSYFARYYEILRNSFFVTDMNGAEDESVEELQELLARIALETLKGKQGYEKRVVELAHVLIDCLIQNFQFFVMENGKFVHEPRNKGNEFLASRLNRITEYMYENYNRRLTLTEIAEREHLSIYYLSHFIKEATGLSFQEFLNFIRVEESEKLLLGTDKKISTISMESGFSAVRYYLKYFTKWFGMHPAEYRKKYTGRVRSRNTMGRFTLLTGKQAEDLLRSHVEDIFDVVRSDKIKVVSVEFDTEEVSWRKSSLYDTFTSLMACEYMKPMAEVFGSIKVREEDFVAGDPGYIIMRHTAGGHGTPPSYNIFFYNFSEKLVKTPPTLLTQSITEEEIRQYDKQMEFFIRFAGLNGQFRIARCRFTKEAILARYNRLCNGKRKANNRENLVRGWMESPVISVDIVTASQTLNVKTQQPGSSMELVIIDPVK
ncbi:MAG: AraC family transcriptional regulator [Anaerovoracaceae bacterium]